VSRDFYEDFLAELKAVDDFLAHRTGDATYVQREDPDVRRLVESIAFFSARTRQAASDQLRHSMLQLARGQLDDFLSPQPARGLVQAIPDELVNEAKLPAGTRLRLTTRDGELGLFSTMVDVTLRPMQIDLAERQPRSGGGVRLVIRIRARRKVTNIDEPLAIYPGYLDDYQASLRLQYGLRRNLRGVSVFYGAAPDPSRTGEPCEFSFGSPPRAHAAPGSSSPIEQLRTFFHFPAQELFFNVSLPRPLPAEWRQAWLCLDLDEQWPSELVVNKDVFRLFVIPIENLVHDAAVPIKCDGTRSRFPIEPARPDAGLALHSVTGVFQQTPAGREPILPIHLAGGGPSYDLEQVGEGEGEGAFDSRLVLRLPDAFTTPRLISVEARWYQPGFDDVAVGKLDVTLQTRHVQGVELRLLGMLAPHRPSALWRDPAAVLHVLSRRASRVLERRDLISLMTLLGADRDSHHAGLDGELLHVEAHEEPADPRRGGGLRQVYRITIGDLDDDRLGLMNDYLRCIEWLLDAWSSNPVRLEVHRRIPGSRPLRMIGSGT
jgi:type VI secretion system protein ImpG